MLGNNACQGGVCAGRPGRAGGHVYAQVAGALQRRGARAGAEKRVARVIKGYFVWFTVVHKVVYVVAKIVKSDNFKPRGGEPGNRACTAVAVIS